MRIQEPSAIVRSAHESEVREINALERRIVEAEDDADEKLWNQAGKVVAELDRGLSQRALAKQWINVRTGEPYAQSHVAYVKQVSDQFTDQSPRPRFRDAYNEIANASKPHVSQNAGENEWYTPEDYIAAAVAVMGGIDLDPASTKAANAIVGASKFYTVKDDGLVQPWTGRVWMNPPYDTSLIAAFCGRLAECFSAGDVTQACVLVNNATETRWFHGLGVAASAICFPLGRVRFWHPEREAVPLQGQAVLYLGDSGAAFRQKFAPFGLVVVRG